MSRLLKFIIFLLLVLLAFYISPFFTPHYQDLESSLADRKVSGPILYMILLIIAIVLSPIPASPLAIAAGSVFGPLLGMLYTLIGATLGALIAFSISRFFINDYAREKLKNYPWYRKIDSSTPSQVAYFVAITRLMPQVSFDLVSYAAGLTRIGPIRFSLATFLGMIPIVFLLSFFGAFLSQYRSIMLTILLSIFLIYLAYKILKKSN